MSAVFLATLRQRGSQFTLGTDVGGATGNVPGIISRSDTHRLKSGQCLVGLRPLAAMVIRPSTTNPVFHQHGSCLLSLQDPVLRLVHSPLLYNQVHTRMHRDLTFP